MGIFGFGKKPNTTRANNLTNIRKQIQALSNVVENLESRVKNLQNSNLARYVQGKSPKNLNGRIFPRGGPKTRAALLAKEQEANRQRNEAKRRSTGNN